MMNGLLESLFLITSFCGNLSLSVFVSLPTSEPYDGTVFELPHLAKFTTLFLASLSSELPASIKRRSNYATKKVETETL